ncbi:hypothetical protein D3C84_1098720 [compost metagenome]
MHHGAVLDVAVLADMDQFVVAAQHGAEPDAGAGVQAHLAHQGGGGGGPAVGMGFDLGGSKAVFHQASSNGAYLSFMKLAGAWFISIPASYTRLTSSTTMIAVRPQILNSPYW